MTVKHCILAGAVAAFCTSVALNLPEPVGAASIEVAAPSADVARGKRLFVAVGCYQCHGYVGQGAQSTGPALVPMRLSDEDFVRYLRMPRGVMPAFSARLLPADDARAVLAYVRSLHIGAPPETIAMLAPYVVRGTSARAPARVAAATAAPSPPPAGAAIQEGGTLFASNCAVCHGAALEGGIGPSLRTTGRRMSAEQIAGLIANPPPGMPKLTPTPLSLAQAAKVAAFVRQAAE